MLTTAFYLLLLALVLVTGMWVGAHYAYGTVRLDTDLSRYLAWHTDPSAFEPASAGIGSADGTRPAPSIPRPGAGRGSPKSHN